MYKYSSSSEWRGGCSLARNNIRCQFSIILVVLNCRTTSGEIMSPKYWLMKAEPDSRVVKGKDVKVGHDYCRDDV